MKNRIIDITSLKPNNLIVVIACGPADTTTTYRLVISCERIEDPDLSKSWFDEPTIQKTIEMGCYKLLTKNCVDTPMYDISDIMVARHADTKKSEFMVLLTERSNAPDTYLTIYLTDLEQLQDELRKEENKQISKIFKDATHQAETIYTKYDTLIGKIVEAVGEGST